MLRSGQIAQCLMIGIGIESRCSPRATAVVADCRYSRIVSSAGRSMVSRVMSLQGRLFGLTVSGWSVLLGSYMVCGLLTLLF